MSTKDLTSGAGGRIHAESRTSSGADLRRLVAEVLAELGDHAEAREAIEDGVGDAIRGRPPRS